MFFDNSIIKSIKCYQHCKEKKPLTIRKVSGTNVLYPPHLSMSIEPLQRYFEFSAQYSQLSFNLLPIFLGKSRLIKR